MFRIVLALLLLAATAAGSAYAVLNGLPAVPTITGICTTQGSIAGGDTVTITGTNLNNAVGVSFGSASAGVLPGQTNWWVNSPTSITAISPPVSSAGAVDVRVTNPSGTSAPVAVDQFTYLNTNLPIVSSILSNNSATGSADNISIYGTNLSTANAVHFGSTPGTSVQPQTNTNNIFVLAPTGLAAGTYPVTVTNSSGTSTATCANMFTIGAPPSAPPIPPTAQRPAYNTGKGYYVVGRGIYDPNGNLFIPIGANQNHYDQRNDNRYFANPNAERLVIYWPNGSLLTGDNIEGQINDSLNNHSVPITGSFFSPAGTACTGSTSIAVLQGCYTQFTGTSGCPNNAPCAPAWISLYGNNTIINPENEWDGNALSSEAPGSAGLWFGAMQAMISAFRSAGFTNPLTIDMLLNGQDFYGLHLAPQLQALDPQHNLIFAIHVYSYWHDASTSACSGGPCRSYNIESASSTIGQMTVPAYYEENGCAINGPNIPAQTCAFSFTASAGLTPLIIMQSAYKNQIGWLFWAWDDTDGSTTGCNFTMLGSPSAPANCTTHGPWCYKNAAGTEVTTSYGQTIIDDPTYGMKAIAKKSTAFSGSPPTPTVCPF